MNVEHSLKQEQFINEASSAAAEYGLPQARLHTDIFLDLLNEKVGITADIKQHKAAFTIFSFLTWTYHYGAWSNLVHEELKIGLIKESYNKIILAAAHELSKDKAITKIVEAADILHGRFDVYYKRLLLELPAKYDAGYEEDLNTFIYIGLDWLKELFRLGDCDLEIITPLFMEDKRIDESLTEIEYLTFQFVATEREALEALRQRAEQ